jgi:hypothetical protein
MIVLGLRPDVELSPFVVNTSSDVGYVAENTLAGSRLNTSLRDTAGSVSVFTREFLDDLAITDIRELVEYSVNGEMDTNSQGAQLGAEPLRQRQRLTAGVLIRGLIASLGMDYFTSITPPRSVSRRPLRGQPRPQQHPLRHRFPGRPLNQSSKTRPPPAPANLRYGAGSWAAAALELDANRCCARTGSRSPSPPSTRRTAAGAPSTSRTRSASSAPSPSARSARVTITAMGETGRDLGAVIRSFSEWSRCPRLVRQPRGLRRRRRHLHPQQHPAHRRHAGALGVTARDGTRRQQPPRHLHRERRHRSSTPSAPSSPAATTTPPSARPTARPASPPPSSRLQRSAAVSPDRRNAAGPACTATRRSATTPITADWQPTRNLAFNLGHNYQRTNAEVTLMTGTEPTLRGDPNRTLGVNGPPNPYAGRLYFDGNWRRDIHFGELRETRLSASYSLEPKWKWLGRHRLAGMVSRTDAARPPRQLVARPRRAAVQRRPQQRQQPHHRAPLPHGGPDFGTYRVGDWRKLPTARTR